jgi:DNA-binding transcriptional MerR regulator
MHSVEEMVRAGCTTRRGVRFWEEKGLLGPVERTNGDTRRYTPEQLDKAKIIAAAQFGGWSLEEIAEMLEEWGARFIQRSSRGWRIKPWLHPAWQWDYRSRRPSNMISTSRKAMTYERYRERQRPAGIAGALRGGNLLWVEAARMARRRMVARSEGRTLDGRHPVQWVGPLPLRMKDRTSTEYDL